MRKKNKTLRAAALLLMLSLVSTSFVGGTFAKYTSSVSATSTANIAKWSVKINETEINAGGDITSFNLFNSIVDTVDGNADAHVNGQLLAPGVKGKVELSIENASDVAIKVAAKADAALLSVEAGSAAVPLKFALGDAASEPGAGSYTDLAGLITAVEAALPSDSSPLNYGATFTKTIYWKWDYEGSGSQTDTSDTALGVASAVATTSYKLKLNVQVTQVD